MDIDRWSNEHAPERVPAPVPAAAGVPDVPDAAPADEGVCAAAAGSGTDVGVAVAVAVALGEAARVEGAGTVVDPAAHPARATAAIVVRATAPKDRIMLWFIILQLWLGPDETIVRRRTGEPHSRRSQLLTAIATPIAFKPVVTQVVLLASRTAAQPPSSPRVAGTQADRPVQTVR
jgi:hypothetical protein